MKSYIVVLGSTPDLSADLKNIEVQAASKAEAIEQAQSQLPTWYFHDCVVKRNPWGGARAGSGQPSKFGEKTKVIRVPESIADKRDLIVAIPELRELLDDWEKDCEDNPNSARRYFLRLALGEIRSLGF